VALVPERKQRGFRSGLTGVVRDFIPPEISKAYLRNMGQGCQMMVVAALQAVAEAGLDESLLRSERTGVVSGSMGWSREVHEQCVAFSQGTKLGGAALQRCMASSDSANLSVLFGTQGPSWSVSAACATGAVAIGQAAQAIRLGQTERMICGGGEEATWQTACHFDALRAFSVREDAPERASRPFDAGRDGLVPSGGAGMLVLEEWEAAKARGARIIAELTGFAMTSDGYDMTTPSGLGAVRCMRAALADAGLGPADIDYVNAHATSTLIGDRVESAGIREVFADGPAISATKSMTGHEMGAAGSNELIYTLLMMEGGFVAPTINLDQLDEACTGLRIVANQAAPLRISTALSNSFGFGGVNACLVVKDARP
jgi:3-oxoacyl-[acyl-carrier-protein] synthase-1